MNEIMVKQNQIKTWMFKNHIKKTQKTSHVQNISHVHKLWWKADLSGPVSHMLRVTSTSWPRKMSTNSHLVVLFVLLTDTCNKSWEANRYFLTYSWNQEEPERNTWKKRCVLFLLSCPCLTSLQYSYNPSRFSNTQLLQHTGLASLSNQGKQSAWQPNKIRPSCYWHHRGVVTIIFKLYCVYAVTHQGQKIWHNNLWLLLIHCAFF